MSIICIYDFETTGLRPGFHDPIQFAAVAIEAGTLREIHHFYSEMRPMRPNNADPKAMAVHGLTIADLDKAPSQGEVAIAFKRWINQFNRPMPCAYNLPFDEQWMASWAPDIQWSYTKCDVLHVARAMLVLSGLASDAKLGTATKYFDIEHDAHDALGDVRATAEILRRIKSMMMSRGQMPLLEQPATTKSFVATGGA